MAPAQSSSMALADRKRAAKAFVERWSALPCVEEEHSRSFWIELLEDVLGIPGATRVLEFERKVKGRKIDVFYEDRGILIEMKGRGIGLDEASVRSKKAGAETPYQQAKWYADNLPFSVRPRWIITCNFDEFRIYDQEKENQEDYVSIALTELPEQSRLLAFFTDQGASRIEREKELSVQAGELVGRLYDQLSQQYLNLATDPREQRSLNVLIVRLVFLLYAEDSGLLHKRDALLDYLRKYPAAQMRAALMDLFRMLDTPDGSGGTANQRDPYADLDLLAFPYVNGGLFADEDIVIPQFTEQIRLDLLLEASQKFDWSGISPTIFGAAFESTLNPATRRAGGMHYTSIENIHKVIDPLFLDDLRAELAEIEGEKIEKNRIFKLKAFQRKLGSLRIFDPACGSGNFLTESYLSLRKLENRVLENLQGDQVGMDFGDETTPIEVTIDQLYGIEINDFAVSVAKTALWIAEEQMMEATQEVVMRSFDFLPLKSNGNIHEGNALRMDWNEVLPVDPALSLSLSRSARPDGGVAEGSIFLSGNPPFLGYSNLSKSQSEDRELLFGKVKTVDYVACWYKKAAEYMRDTRIRAAFVSTNSICQGQQVEPLWRPLFEQGIGIDFAWQSFVWNSEANDQAHVHVIIVGFSYAGRHERMLFDREGHGRAVENINGYLQPAPNVFIAKRTNPLCCVEGMAAGGKPTEGGNLILDEREIESFIQRNPEAEKWIRPFSMGEDFIKGKPRYCIWLPDVDVAEWSEVEEVANRVAAVKEMRLASSKEATRKKAETPWRFDEIRETGDVYVGVPSVSSERRDYVPMGFIDNGMIPGNMLYFVPSSSLYVFGVMMSQFHNAWMRAVAGRLEMRYRYANTVVYNNFAWPGVTRESLGVPVEEAVSPEVRARIESCAQAVLDARAAHPDKTLADLYDPEKMPADLLSAHKALDAAVEAAYGVDFNGDEERIVAHLFELYAQLTGE